MARVARGRVHPAAVVALVVVLLGMLLLFRNELLYSCSEVRVGGTTLLRQCRNRLTGAQWTATPFGEWTIRR